MSAIDRSAQVHELTVSWLKREEEDYKTLHQILRGWEKTGRSSESVQLCNELRTNLVFPALCPHDVDIQNSYPRMEGSVIVLCKDQDEKIQDIALILNPSNVKKDHIEIFLVVSNPENTKKVTCLPKRIQSGSVLIASVAQKCLQENRAGIYVEADTLVAGFLKRIGYKEIPGERRSTLRTVIPMVLSAEKIREMAQHRQKPFHNIQLDAQA